MCLILCLVRSLLLEKDFSQSLHWYGFSPVCIIIWLLRWLFFEKDNSQFMHWEGFFPVCVLIWLSRFDLLEQMISQYLHWYGFTMVCDLNHLMCFYLVIMWGSVSTIFALVWFLIIGSPYMNFNITILWGLFTITPMIWLLSCVGHFMTIKIHNHYLDVAFSQ